ncbi:MAG TPA: hypothetical protein VG650_16855 [Mycobacteriales bacterium]|nr:hypothetical protein [Mycobacteriales bacterium]
MSPAVWSRRFATTVVAGGSLVALTAVPAQAHSLGPGVTAMNYRTTLVSVSPRLPGVSLRVVDDGLHVIACNTTPTPLVIDGYNGEPYLRVDARGAWENVHSPAVYLNASFTPGAVPKLADATATPQWKRIGSGDSVMWHDHRLHWMGTSPPAQVQRDPGAYNLISTWQINGRYGDQRLRAIGELAWVPPPDPAGWLVVAAVLAAAVAAAAIRRRVWLRVAMISLALADLARATGLVIGRGGSTWMRLAALPARGLLDLGVAGVLAAAALRGRRREAVTAYVATFCSAAVLLLGSAVSLPTLWRSQVIAWHPSWVERGLVTVSAGIAVGLLVAGLVHVRRAAREATVRAAAVALAGSLLVTGCAGGSTSAGGSTTLTTRQVRGLGTVLTDGGGHVLYMFVPDNRRAVTCSTICQGTWPPLTAGDASKVLTRGGVRRDLIGSDPDPFGGPDVVTYAGWPLYGYVADLDPGVAGGQALDLNGGLWYVISPTGRVIRRSP